MIVARLAATEPEITVIDVVRFAGLRLVDRRNTDRRRKSSDSDSMLFFD
jgi:hypothetical protein